ncbi:MAG: DUF3575 domain-containing protein [Bacteroides sp.]|nr:DUF3575 domain-containing protein [Bacteroides sp.]
MKHILPILLGILCIGAVYGEDIETDSVKVHFRVSHTEIDPSFNGNGETLDSIFHKLSTDSRLSGPTRTLASVNVIGAASPEGSVDFNRRLSEKRAQAIFSLFRNKGFLNDTIAHFSYLGRDWTGLRHEVGADPNVPYREEVISLLDRIGSQNAPSDPLGELKTLHQGIPYKYLLTNLFPQLRASRLVVEYERQYPHLLIPEMPLTGPSVTPSLTFLPSPRQSVMDYQPANTGDERPFYMGLKTNMLLDALLLPNIGAEFYVGKKWSVTADWMYGWWDHDVKHYYWRAYGGTLGVRKWFGRKASEKPLTGHHIGIFAGAVTYDFEFGHEGIMGGLPHRTLWDRCNFISGVEYGYSLPVARRLNIDFTVGFGYLGGKYLKYKPQYGFYIWQSTHRLHWFGPTKAEVSLVWLIGHDNYNRKKGGKQ